MLYYDLQFNKKKKHRGGEVCIKEHSAQLIAPSTYKNKASKRKNFIVICRIAHTYTNTNSTKLIDYEVVLISGQRNDGYR